MALDAAYIFVVMTIIFTVTRFSLEALADSFWPWLETSKWLDVAPVLASFSVTLELPRLLRRIAQERPTIGQYIVGFRLVRDDADHPATKGQMLTAYLGFTEPGEDYWKRLWLNKDDEISFRRPPFIRAVSTRAP